MFAAQVNNVLFQNECTLLDEFYNGGVSQVLHKLYVILYVTGYGSSSTLIPRCTGIT